MGTLSRAVVGAAILPMAFLPTAALAATTDPTSQATSTQTTSPTDSATATGTAAATSTATATATSTATATGTATASTTPSPSKTPRDPFATIFPLGVTPKSGPAGTAIGVTPTAKCVDPDGVVGAEVVIALVDVAKTDNEDGGVVGHVIATTAEDGSWATTKITVPTKAQAGTRYGVAALCYGADSAGNPQLLKVYANDVAYDFVVTGAPKAPVAKPVTKNPSFTG